MEDLCSKGICNVEEVWKDVKNFEGLYQVSSLGRIKSFVKYKNGAIMNPGLNENGYPQVLLYKDGKRYTQRVHRLIAEVFLPDYYDKPQVNHIDGNKTNNKVTNLEMATNSENQLHAYKNKLELPKKQSKVNQYDLDGNFIRSFEYVRDAGNELGIDESSIIKCCRNKRKTAGKFIWKYVDDTKSR